MLSILSQPTADNINHEYIKPAVLKLGPGVVTLLRVAKYFIGVAKELFSGQFTLDSL
jgi:hypothetical protein